MMENYTPSASLPTVYPYGLFHRHAALRLLVLALFALLLTAAGPDDETLRGQIVEVEPIGTMTASEIAERMREAGVPGRPLYGVTLYRIVYHTRGVHGEPALASGALAVPDGMTDAAPLLSFQHGTTLARHNVASVRGFDLINMGFGASGYVTAMPDYLGLGVSEGLHPYVHAASLSTAVVDFLRAARQFCAQYEVALSGQLFLMGYSEGGYATMAAHRAIEAYHAREFEVTASAPMAGPYSLSDVMLEQMVTDEPYPTPVYLPFTLLAYNRAYGLFDTLEEMFETPYAEQLPALFDGTRSWRDINAELPAIPRSMLRDAFVAALRDDANHPVRRALRENDVHDWRPLAPMKLFHCVGDEQVPFRNAEIAAESFRRHGAVQVEVAALEFGGHEECAPPAIFLGKLWFDMYLESGPVLMRQARASVDGREE